MDLLTATAALHDALDRLPLPRGVSHVYNPLRYAWAPHERYLERFMIRMVCGDGSPGCATQRRRILIAGMNPGPYGMAQTGVPFGDVPHAREILGYDGWPNWCPTSMERLLVDLPIGQPAHPHPKRLVQGFACTRVEESGYRLWMALKIALHDRMTGATTNGMNEVLREVFALNFCPLVFWDSDGKNITPDNLAAPDLIKLRGVCAPYVAEVVRAMQPEVVVCVGRFAEREVAAALVGAAHHPDLVYLLHPSPRACTAAQFSEAAAKVLAPFVRKEAP